MEKVPSNQPRDHAWHWGTVLDRSPNRKRLSRFPAPAGDLVVGIVAGLLLGNSIVYAVMRDSVPVTAVYAAMFLILHTLILGIAMIGDETRPSRKEFLGIAAVYGLAGLLSAAITLILLG
jgi:hypothetical protein